MRSHAKSDTAQHDPLSPDRFDRAANECWRADDAQAIVLTGAGPKGRLLRSQLQAMGVEVFDGRCGTAWSASMSAPVIVIDAQDWQCPDLRRRVQSVRRDSPGSALCIVTGAGAMASPTADDQMPAFSDARAYLQAAGLQFFSIGGACHDNPV